MLRVVMALLHWSLRDLWTPCSSALTHKGVFSDVHHMLYMDLPF